MSDVKKTTRKQLNFETKIKIIRSIERGCKQTDLAREYGVSRAMISALYKNKEQIIEAIASLPKTSIKSRESNQKHLDAALLIWFTTQRSKNLPISGLTLLEKANTLALSLSIPNFKCSTGWIDRFKKRHLISSSVISGESGAVNQNVIDEWLKYEWPDIRKNYDDKDIFNADETGLLFKVLPNKTLKFKGENCHGGKL